MSDATYHREGAEEQLTRPGCGAWVRGAARALGMHDFGRVRGQRLSLVAIFRGDRLENALKLSEGQFSRRHQPIASAERRYRYLRYPAVRPIAVQYDLIIVDVHVLPL